MIEIKTYEKIWSCHTALVDEAEARIRADIVRETGCSRATADKVQIPWVYDENTLQERAAILVNVPVFEAGVDSYVAE